MSSRFIGDEAFGFRVREIRELPDVSSRMWRMEFIKNGAQLVWIENEDRNKTFAIAFRTLPDDDTGVAHIIEHSVLCGSEKFPVKSPLAELKKSSLGTYINACTGADYTRYPVSSFNDQDLLNLTEVYLDAVFAPLSVKNDWAMPQERNVVFNEMKGAMASPDGIARRKLSEMLFPSHVYGRNSAGDPAAIPTLTMEKYREFYERFYHPSNARVFLYGKINLESMLKLIASYLGRYPRREVVPMQPFQPPVSSVQTIEYPCDTVANHTCVYEGWVFGTWRDVEKNLAMGIICQLAGSNTALLTKALLDAGVCDDFLMESVGGYQNQVNITFVNVRDGKVEEARRIFRDTLSRLVRDGLHAESIAAILDSYEFERREGASIGPRGIEMQLAALSTWLYGGDPAERIEFSKHIESLRRKNGTGYYERLVVETILENPHHAALVLKPDASMKEDIVIPASGPKAPEDKPADLAKIPRLRLSDIPERGEFTGWTVETVDGVEVVHPLVAEDGITYLELAFAVNDLTDEELLDLPLLGLVLGELPAGGRDVTMLNQEMGTHLGNYSSRECAMDNGTYFTVGTRFLASHAEAALGLIRDILVLSDFSSVKLIDDIRTQRKHSFENGQLCSGDDIARIHAARSHSAQGRVSELFYGFAQYHHLKNGRCGDLGKLAAKILVRGRLVASVANPPSDDFAHRLIQAVPSGGPSGRKTAPFVRGESAALSDCYFTKSQITFTAMCAKLPEGIASSGAFAIASQILSQDVLWREIRVKGGAYGAHFSCDMSGNMSILSWRDPHPDISLDVFAKCGSLLREFVKSGQSFEHYKVSLGGMTDSPHCTAIEASFAFKLFYLDGITVADRQRWRSEILHTSADDLLRFADILDQVLPSATSCVIGEEALARRCGLPVLKMDCDYSI